MNKRLKTKFRKAADGGNLALVALAIGVIIIIGMYVFTSRLGGNAKKSMEGANKTLSEVNADTWQTIDEKGSAGKSN